MKRASARPALRWRTGTVRIGVVQFIQVVDIPDEGQDVLVSVVVHFVGMVASA